MNKPLLLAAAAFVALSATPVWAKGATPGTDYAARVARVLKDTPLIDGHNDWAETLAGRAGDKRWTIDLRRLPGSGDERYNTDIERLRKGGVGGQFWSVYVPADLPPLDQVKATLDQIDLVRDIVARYPETFELARTAADVRRIHKAGRIASMMGVEGGGQIAGDLSVLRAYQGLGAGYLTLTHPATRRGVRCPTRPAARRRARNRAVPTGDRRMIHIVVSSDPIDAGAELLATHLAGAGGVASFTGVVRGDDGVETLALEHYPGVTEAALQRLAEEAVARWQLIGVRVVHRVGAMVPGDVVVFVGAAAAHRAP
eukprot:gene30490-40513_t